MIANYYGIGVSPEFFKEANGGSEGVVASEVACLADAAGLCAEQIDNDWGMKGAALRALKNGDVPMMGEFNSEGDGHSVAVVRLRLFDMKPSFETTV